MTWLEAKVRDASLRQLVGSSLVVAAVIGLLVFNYRYLNNYFLGLHEIPRSDLLTAANADDLPRYWVTTNADRIMDTGVDIITVRKRHGMETGRSVTGHYFVAQIADKLMLIKAASSQRPDPSALQGSLTAPASSMIERLVQNAKQPGIRDKFLPLMLDMSDFTTGANILLFVAGIAAAGAVLWAIFALRGVRNPHHHPALQALAKSGADPVDVSNRIQDEVAQRRTVRLKDGVQLTSSHLLQSGGMKFNLRPLSDLLWAHPQVTTKKLYGIIPTSKSHATILNFADAAIKVGTTKDQVPVVMEHLANVAPWALLAYSADIESAYKKERQALAAHIAARRMQATQAASPAPGSAA